MNRPVIALISRKSEKARTFAWPVVAAGVLYVEAIERAGGIPMVLPPTRDITLLESSLRRCDGVLAMGGGDVDPSFYGEEPHAECYNVDTDNDTFEIAALTSALALDMPTLAICRGHQVLNVALGGSLIQHLDNTDDHKGREHLVKVEPGSRTAAALGSLESNGYSAHHQAIKQVADALSVVGRADDGIIEAVEHRDATWVVGVQWHPERTAATNASQQRLFDALVQEASKRVSTR